MGEPERDDAVTSAPQLSLRREAMFAVLLLLVFLVVADGVWVGIRAARAKGQLEQARASVVAARAALSDGDITAAVTRALSAGQDTSYASRLTHDPIWHLDCHLPFIGSSMRSVAVLAAATDQVAEQALPALTSSVDDLRGGRFRGQDGTINLAVVTHAANALVTASASLASARAQVEALPAHPLISAAGVARSQLLDQLNGLLSYLSGTTKAARLAPAMLGADGPRRYFLALMNPAEARGAGGLVGAYGIVIADHGRLSLETAGSDNDLTDFKSPVTDVSPDFTARWRPFYGDSVWRNATDSPNFPYDAISLTAMWKKAKGEQLDGVIALDPATAGALLGQGHSVALPNGQTLTGPQLPTYVEQTLYVDFSNDPVGRKQVLVEIEKQLFASLSSAADPTTQLKVLGHAAGNRQLLLESNHPSEQTILATTPLGGVMPDAPGPFVGLVVDNAIGNKMDAYLHRTLAWTGSPCPPAGQRRTLTTTLTLHSDPPARLPDEVGGTHGAPSLGHLPLGSNHSWISVYGSVGAIATSVTLDGKLTGVVEQVERSHPVVGLYVDLAPGQTRVLTVQWADPPVPASGGGQLEPQPPFLQPLVIPANVTTSVSACS